jgi:hypothetical protein
MEIKALLIFCEGSHDVTFVGQVFKRCLGFQKVEWKFSDYPAPFNALFKTSVQNYAAKDLSLDMADKFFLPDCVFKKEDNLILVFNAGGGSQVDKIKKLLKNFLTLFVQSAIFPDNAADIVKEANYLFLYDADHIGTTTLFNKIKQDFNSIDDETTWSFADWNFLNNSFGAIAENKAAYIWGADTQSGTLEDILLPMFEEDQRDIVDKAISFVDSAFTWEINSSDKARKISQIAKRKKAIITCVGQNKCPSYSLAVILKDDAKGLLMNNLIEENIFLSNPSVKAFVDFIKQFVGI